MPSVGEVVFGKECVVQFVFPRGEAQCSTGSGVGLEPLGEGELEGLEPVHDSTSLKEFGWAPFSGARRVLVPEEAGAVEEFRREKRVEEESRNAGHCRE